MSNRRVRRRWPAAALVLLAIWAVGLGERGWVEGQWRALVVLAGSLHIPVVSDTGVLTDAPSIRDVRVAGVPTTIAVPPGGGRRPAVVFLNGATAAGRHERHVERLTRALGEAGFIAVVPDPPGLAQGALTPQTLRSLERVVEAVSRRPDVSRTGLLGVSVGCSLGLVAAEGPLASVHLSGIACLAPFTDLRGVIMMALTGSYPEAPGKLVPYHPNAFVSLVIARSLAAVMPDDAGRAILLARLLAVSDNAHEPLAGLPTVPADELDPAERALLRLLENHDPARFADLYAGLPKPVRAGIAELSPIAGAARLHVPVEIASSPHDSYFPLVQYPPFLRAAPDAHLTVTSILGHAVPHPTLGNLGGLTRLDGFAVRSLRDFAPPVAVNWLAVIVSLAALGLIAGEGFAPRRGLGALAGAASLLAALPALFHPVGVSAPLAVAAVAAVAGGVVVAANM
jgi:pimeloyl-ACP methyl ester carboxylesterase